MNAHASHVVSNDLHFARMDADSDLESKFSDGRDQVKAITQSTLGVGQGH